MYERRIADRRGTDRGKPPARLVADQLFSRVAGALPVEGNAVRLLRDGAENYAAWLDAIAAARSHVQFENYIFRADRVGRQFADALAAKAREGVRVRLLYDWLGSLGTSPGFWRRLRRAGVEVRCFNRPRLDSPFGWLSRNHRKTVSVDGMVGFVAGLCVGREWVGDPARRVAPWRDTGIELRGPAVADLDAAFAESWAHAGGAAPASPPFVPDHPAHPLRGGDPQGGHGHGREHGREHGHDPRDAEEVVFPGDVALRVIGSKPNTMGLYRFDQLIAGIARKRLWLTDAYFAGTTAYVRTLCDAARDGVDVRLLVPGASDIPLVKSVSRAGYRALLEAGIRVFEWNGPMLHAKTAVADGRWARIGSSNLNLASWLGNWELDVAIEDPRFAARMERMFEQDLGNATEIVLDPPLRGGRVHSATRRPNVPRRGSPGRLAAGAVGLGSTVSAAITNHRALGPAEARVMGAAGGLLLLLTLVFLLLPRLVTVPLALLASWVALTLLVRAWKLRREPPLPEAEEARLEHDTAEDGPDGAADDVLEGTPDGASDDGYDRARSGAGPGHRADRPSPSSREPATPS